MRLGRWPRPVDGGRRPSSDRWSAGERRRSGWGRRCRIRLDERRPRTSEGTYGSGTDGAAPRDGISGTSLSGWGAQRAPGQRRREVWRVMRTLRARSAPGRWAARVWRVGLSPGQHGLRHAGPPHGVAHHARPTGIARRGQVASSGGARGARPAGMTRRGRVAAWGLARHARPVARVAPGRPSRPIRPRPPKDHGSHRHAARPAPVRASLTNHQPRSRTPPQHQPRPPRQRPPTDHRPPLDQRPPPTSRPCHRPANRCHRPASPPPPCPTAPTRLPRRTTLER